MARVNAPARSPQIEQLLSSREFTWDYREGITIDAFDEERSLHNQARVSKPLDENTVGRYVTALTNGDIFPAIVCAEQGTQPLLIVDGNHRFAAHKRRETKRVDAYVIKGATAQQVTLLTFEMNTKHGLPSSETDRTHQALYLMDSGITAEDAARRLGLKAASLRAAQNMAAVDRRAEDAGINRRRWDSLASAAKLRLGQISTDEGFGALAMLTIDAGLATADISAAVNEMAKLRSSRKQVDYVTGLRSVYGERLRSGGARDTPGVGRQTRTPRMILGMALGQMAALPEPDAIAERMTEDDKLDYLKRIDSAMTRLTAIRDRLKK